MGPVASTLNTARKMTQVEALARYAARASFDDLSPESRKQLPVHILDSPSCCIALLRCRLVASRSRSLAEPTRAR